MRIALVCEYFPISPEREMRGGVEARTYFIARHLARRNDVTVYSIREPGQSPQSEFEGMRVLRVAPEVEYSQSSSLLQRFMFMRNAERLLRAGDYDVVDGASVMGYPPAWRSGAPSRIVTYHDVWLGQWVKNLGPKGLFGEAMERYVLSRKWDHYIAVSYYTRGNLMREGISGDRITVAPNGIDVAEYSAIEARKFDRPTVCAIARLVSYKRLDDLIRACAALRSEFPDMQLIIVGTGPMERSLKELALSLGIGDCVEFMGYVVRHSQVLETLKASHAFCLPSAVEGYGISVVEAMALGVPYVASDIPAIREATSGGEGGLLFRVGDVNDLVEKLRRVLSGAVVGGAKDIGRYDWGRSAAIVEGVYAQEVRI
jgi:glycosyltransferase involved in cell wall biosynthesis